MLSDVTILLVLTVVIRHLPVFLMKDIGSDSAYHLVLREELIRNRLRMPERISTHLLDERQRYPWLYHLYLCFFPRKLLDTFPALPNAILDAAAGSCLYLFCLQLPVFASSSLKFNLPLWIGILYITAPCLTAESDGPRAYSVTPRVGGETSFLVGLLSLCYWYIFDEIFMYGAAAFFWGLSLLTSKFTAQVVVLGIPLLGMFLFDVWILTLPMFSFAAAMLFSLGRYKDIFYGQIFHFRWYRDFQKQSVNLERRNNYGEIFSLFRDILSLENFSFAKIISIMKLLFRLTYARAILWSGPLLLGAIFVSASAVPWGSAPTDRLFPFFYFWILSSLIIFALTSLRPLFFLGEAERYLEYAVAPALLLLGVWLAGQQSSVVLFMLEVFLAHSLLCFFASTLLVLYRRHSSCHTEFAELLAFLSRLPFEANMLSIPFPLSESICCRLFRPFLVTLDTVVWAKQGHKIFSLYPWPSNDFHMWGRDYKLDYVVVDKRYTSDSEYAPCKYELFEDDKVFENRRYQVFSFRRSTFQSTHSLT